MVLMMQFFSCPSDLTLAYEMAGEGSPLVLVHGSVSDHMTAPDPYAETTTRLLLGN